MKYIRKSKEPKSLKHYRSAWNSTYEDYREKDDLRKALLKEQGFICCYCMQRISKVDMKIEHWKSQSKYPALQLDYNNLHATCKGNEGQPKHLEHCDTRKKDIEIKISPLNRNCESLIHYGSDGRIYSNDEIVNDDLNITLNLNQQTLKENRKVMIDALIKGLAKKFPNGSWTASLLKHEIIRWSALEDNKYSPYCQVVVYYLKKKLKQTD